MSLSFHLQPKTYRRALGTTLVSLALLAGAVLAVHRTTQAAVQQSGQEQALLDDTNRARTDDGERPLRWNERLYAAAETRAADMFSRQYFDHVAPDGQTPWAVVSREYAYTEAGENLAIDFKNPADAVPAWLKSPSHRANLLDSRFEDTAIAVVQGTMNGRATTIIVQLFATPASLARLLP